MGSGFSVTDRVGKSESIEKWTMNTLVLVFSWDLLAIRKI